MPTVVVRAAGQAASSVWPGLELLVDGKQVGSVTVANSAPTDYQFTVNVSDGKDHTIGVRYPNDWRPGDNGDRNLFVDSVRITADGPGGSKFTADLPPAAGRYRKGDANSKDVITGQREMYWQGTMEFAVPASFFPANTDAPTAPPKPVSPPPVSPPVSPPVAPPPPPVSPPVSPPATARSTWSTRGADILDANGQPVRLTLVNTAGAEHADLIPVGLWARAYKPFLNQIKALGFNGIRYPYCDDAIVSKKTTGYTFNVGAEDGSNRDLVGKTPLQIMEIIVNHCRSIGLLVMLDHHRTTAGTDKEAGTMKHGLWFDSAWPEARVIDNFAALARLFGKNPAVIGLDIHNEPNTGIYSGGWNGVHWSQPNMNVTANGKSFKTGGADKDWPAFVERAGNAVHKLAPHWLMFVEGLDRTFGDWKPKMAEFGAWGELTTAAKPGRRPIEFNIPNRLVYAPHHYRFGLPQHIANAKNFPDNMPEWWSDAWAWAIDQKVAPVLLGEVGGFMTDDADRKWIRKLFATYGDKISYAYWCWGPLSGDTGGILLDDWKTVSPDRYGEVKANLFRGDIVLPAL